MTRLVSLKESESSPICLKNFLLENSLRSLYRPSSTCLVLLSLRLLLRQEHLSVDSPGRFFILNTGY